jgi:hypothetical protein
MSLKQFDDDPAFTLRSTTAEPTGIFVIRSSQFNTLTCSHLDRVLVLDLFEPNAAFREGLSTPPILN